MAGQKSFRRLRMGLSTILGFRPQGFFIPYRHADSALPLGRYSEIEKIFIKSDSYYIEFINKFNNYAAEFDAIGPDNPPEPRWNQDWFPPLCPSPLYQNAGVIPSCTHNLVPFGLSPSFPWGPSDRPGL